MIPFPTLRRWLCAIGFQGILCFRIPVLRGLSTVCGLMAIDAAAVSARAQCSPQEMAKLIAPDAADGDQFGFSVTVSGDTAVVGSYRDDHIAGGAAGSAYVYVFVGGVWTFQQKLIAADAAALDNFGSSVAISGDTAVVGAWNDDHAGGVDAGSAYVFTRTGGVWTQQAKLVASDAAANDFFGWSIGLSGDTAVVGTSNDDHAGGVDAGSAYVFARFGSVWTEQAKLTASDAATNDQFAWSVAVSGDTVVVGAYLDNNAGGNDSGSAYVFARTGILWTEQAKLTASDAAALDQFGYSVAVSGDTTAIGSHFDDTPVGGNAGSAYVFVRAGGVWTQQAKLTASDAAIGDSLGKSIALSGDTLAVGASFDDHPGATNAGSAYVFTRSGTVWTQRAKLIGSDTAAQDQYGHSVAVSGDISVVGTQFADLPGEADAGSAYAIDLNCDIDTDGDGVLDVNDVCPNNTPGLPVDCTGRPKRDADNDCLVNASDVPLIVDELLLITTPPIGCNSLPLRDINGDTAVDGADVQQIVDEILGQ